VGARSLRVGPRAFLWPVSSCSRSRRLKGRHDNRVRSSHDRSGGGKLDHFFKPLVSNLEAVMEIPSRKFRRRRRSLMRNTRPVERISISRAESPARSTFTIQRRRCDIRQPRGTSKRPKAASRASPGHTKVTLKRFAGHNDNSAQNH